MPERDPETSRDGLRTALELFEVALELQRQNLRREFPDAPDEEIERHLAAWMLERRGAERGDAVGRVCNRDFSPR